MRVPGTGPPLRLAESRTGTWGIGRGIQGRHDTAPWPAVVSRDARRRWSGVKSSSATAGGVHAGLGGVPTARWSGESGQAAALFDIDWGADASLAMARGASGYATSATCQVATRRLDTATLVSRAAVRWAGRPSSPLPLVTVGIEPAPRSLRQVRCERSGGGPWCGSGAHASPNTGTALEALRTGIGAGGVQWPSESGARHGPLGAMSPGRYAQGSAPEAAPPETEDGSRGAMPAERAATYDAYSSDRWRTRRERRGPGPAQVGSRPASAHQVDKERETREDDNN